MEHKLLFFSIFLVILVSGCAVQSDYHAGIDDAYPDCFDSADEETKEVIRLHISQIEDDISYLREAIPELENNDFKMDGCYSFATSAPCVNFTIEKTGDDIVYMKMPDIKVFGV